MSSGGRFCYVYSKPHGFRNKYSTISLSSILAQVHHAITLLELVSSTPRYHSPDTSRYHSPRTRYKYPKIPLSCHLFEVLQDITILALAISTPNYHSPRTRYKYSTISHSTLSISGHDVPPEYLFLVLFLSPLRFLSSISL